MAVVGIKRSSLQESKNRGTYLMVHQLCQILASRSFFTIALTLMYISKRRRNLLCLCQITLWFTGTSVSARYRPTAERYLRYMSEKKRVDGTSCPDFCCFSISKWTGINAILIPILGWFQWFVVRSVSAHTVLPSSVFLYTTRYSLYTPVSKAHFYVSHDMMVVTPNMSSFWRLTVQYNTVTT